MHNKPVNKTQKGAFRPLFLCLNKRMLNPLIAGTFFLAIFTSGLLALWVKPFLVLASVVALVPASMRGTYRFDPLDALVLGLFALMLVSIGWAMEPFYTATSMIIMALLPVFYLTARMVDVPRIWLIGATTLAALMPWGWAISGQGVTFLPWLNVNQFALFVNLGLSLAIMRLYKGSNAPTWLWGCILVMQAAVMLSESRSSATLCLITPILAAALLGFGPHWKKALILFATGLVFLVAIQGAALGILADQTDLTSLQVRLMVWSAAFQAFLERPILGAGIGNFVAAYAPLRDASDPTSGLSAHNDMLHMMVELGVIGAILVCGMAVLALRTIWADKALLLAFLVFGAQGLMTTLWPHPAILMMLAILLAGLVHKESVAPVHAGFQKTLWVGLMIWLGYTLLVTLAGVEMRRAVAAFESGDLQAGVAHLNAANHYYMPDDPRATALLLRIREELESLH